MSTFLYLPVLLYAQHYIYSALKKLILRLCFYVYTLKHLGDTDSGEAQTGVNMCVDVHVHVFVIGGRKKEMP